MRLIDADFYCATVCRCNRRECDKGKCPIHNAPTAYDIDKVIKELEDYMSPYDDLDEGYIRDEIGQAIEIVKQGVVTDNCCEWKIDGVYLHSPHNRPFVTCIADDEDYRYNFCPVCGKKIKVVE